MESQQIRSSDAAYPRRDVYSLSSGKGKVMRLRGTTVTVGHGGSYSALNAQVLIHAFACTFDLKGANGRSRKWVLATRCQMDA
jgi:hypothetical protein